MMNWMLKKIDDRTEDQEESLCRVRRGLCFVDSIGTSRFLRSIKLVIIFGWKRYTYLIFGWKRFENMKIFLMAEFITSFSDRATVATRVDSNFTENLLSSDAQVRVLSIAFLFWVDMKERDEQNEMLWSDITFEKKNARKYIKRRYLLSSKKSLKKKEERFSF